MLCASIWHTMRCMPVKFRASQANLVKISSTCAFARCCCMCNYGRLQTSEGHNEPAGIEGKRRVLGQLPSNNAHDVRIQLTSALTHIGNQVLTLVVCNKCATGGPDYAASFLQGSCRHPGASGFLVFVWYCSAPRYPWVSLQTQPLSEHARNSSSRDQPATGCGMRMRAYRKR